MGGGSAGGGKIFGFDDGEEDEDQGRSSLFSSAKRGARPSETVADQKPSGDADAEEQQAQEGARAGDEAAEEPRVSLKQQRERMLMGLVDAGEQGKKKKKKKKKNNSGVV